MKNKALILGICVLLGLQPVFGQKAYQNGEQESFNQGWLFTKGEQAGAEKIEFDDSGWRPLDLPHDWAIEGPFDVKYNARAGGLPFHGTGWYRKHFSIPVAQEGKRVKVIFDGAMSLAKVWMNGEYLGERPYGYTTFVFDITDVVKTGEENVIAVKLTPEDLSSRWYPGAGIYRNTWLEFNEPIHFSQWATYVSTPEVGKDNALVKVVTSFENHQEGTAELTLVSEILDPSGRKVAEESRMLLLEAGKGELKRIKIGNSYNSTLYT